MIWVIYKEFGDYDVLMAEVLEQLHGLQQCVALSFLQLEIAVDFQPSVFLVSSQGLIQWPLCYTVSHICRLLCSSIQTIFWEANAISDALTSLNFILINTFKRLLILHPLFMTFSL